MDVNRVSNVAPPPPPPPAAAPAAAPAAPAVASVPVAEVPVAAPAVTNIVPVATVPIAEQSGGYPTEQQRERGVQPLEQAVTALNRTLSPHLRHMSVDTHQATGRIMVAVYDSDTQEIIREIPPERVLDAHAGLMEMAGLLMDTRG